MQTRTHFNITRSYAHSVDTSPPHTHTLTHSFIHYPNLTQTPTFPPHAHTHAPTHTDAVLFTHTVTHPHSHRHDTHIHGHTYCYTHAGVCAGQMPTHILSPTNVTMTGLSHFGGFSLLPDGLPVLVWAHTCVMTCCYTHLHDVLPHAFAKGCCPAR